MPDPVSTSTDTGATSAPVVASSQPDTAPSSPSSSWDDAFEGAGLTGSPDSADAAVAPPTPAPATAAPEADPNAPAAAVVPAPSDKGPIPFERHQAILDNARKKTLGEVASRVEQHFGPAIQLQQRLRSDPAGTLTQLFDEAMSNPDLGPTLRSHAARVLAGSRGKPAGSEEPQPDLSGQDDQGQTVRFYSAEQQAKRDVWARQQILAEVDARTAPFQKDLQTRAQREQAEQQNAAIRQNVTSRLTTWREQPGFTEHEAEIAEQQAALVAQGLDTWSALGLAYTKVYQAKVLPTVRADSQTALVKEAARKAAGSTAHSGTVAPSTQARPKDWDEAFANVGLT